MNKEKTLEIIKKIKKGNINVRKTIENTIKSNYLGAMHYYIAPVKDEVLFPKDMVEIIDNDKSYDNYLDEEFMEKVEECLNNEGVYISLVYGTTMEPKWASEDCEVINFDYKFEEEVDCDMTTTYLSASLLHKKFVISSYSEIYGDMEEDHGIIVKNTNEGQEVLIGTRCSGPTSFHPPSLVEFSSDGEDYDIVSLNNPLTQIIVEIMNEVIVYEE